MFGGLTHEPALRLARQLIDIAPAGLEHVFLADSGSVSVEVAMKMALQHQRGLGRPCTLPLPHRPRRLPRRHLRRDERLRPDRRHALDVRRRPSSAGLRRTATAPRRGHRDLGGGIQDAGRGARRRGRRADRRAPPARGRRHAPLPGRLPQGVSRSRRRTRLRPRVRRDRDRFRTHRHPVRRRGRRGGARHHVRGQGADRRLPQSCRGAVYDGRRTRACLPASPAS